MLEPTSAMTWGDAIASASGDSTERGWVSRRMTPHILLLERPARLDWVQIGRVRRHVEEADLARRAGRGDARVVVRSKIVHDEHVVWAKLGEEDVLQPSDESLLVCRGEHGGERDPAGQSDRAEHGQVLSPIHRHALDEFVPALDPCMRATHREVHAGFLEQNDPFGGHPPNATQELSTLHFDVWPQTFQRPAAFFLTTYP